MKLHDTGKEVAERHDGRLTPHILGLEDAIRNAGSPSFGGRLLAALMFEAALVAKLLLAGKTDEIEVGFKAFVREIKHPASWLGNGV